MNVNKVNITRVRVKIRSQNNLKSKNKVKK